MYQTTRTGLASDRHSTMEHVERSFIAGRLSRRGFIQAFTAAGLATAGLHVLADDLDAMRVNQNQRAATLQPSYDYIVVGTGSAASALVGRLAPSGANILMVEAGDWDVAPSVMDPSVSFTNLGTERDWQDVALPSQSVNGCAIPEHMGKVVGGSSINATTWARPFNKDLDYWADESGDSRWGTDPGLHLSMKGRTVRGAGMRHAERTRRTRRPWL